jgi:dihydrofolate reductase
MRKLIVSEFMSLDGVMQAPGGPEEDTDGGFKNGGWHMRYLDDVAQQWILKNIVDAGGLMLGRRTYQIFAGYWPTASEEQQVIAEPLNTMPKYVASTTLTEPLGWNNSALLKGDLAQAVTELKQQDGGYLHIIGSVMLAHTLVELGLVDEFKLMIDPLVLGAGKRVFGEGTTPRPLRLVESQVTSMGTILATYAAAGG